jgi:hypothetical protein
VAVAKKLSERVWRLIALSVKASALIFLLQFVMGCFSTAAFAQAPSSRRQIEWKEIEPGFFLAEAQMWPPGARRGFTFSAVRFHLGYFELRLLGIAEFSKRISEQTSREKVVSTRSSRASVDFGLKFVYNANPFDRPIRALAAGGFPAIEGRPVNLGFLKVDKHILSEFDLEGPSAVFCLHSPRPAYSQFKYQVPVFYRSNDNRFKDCSDAVQVGPRILEDPSRIAKDRPGGEKVISYFRKNAKGLPDPQPVYLGIPEKDAKRTPYYRTILAVDEPGRDEDKINPRNTARNAYFIVTETSVTLWEIQEMLVNPAFYANELVAPYFAINLVGGDYAGLLVKDPGKGEVQGFGNVDITQASVFAVLPRK